MAPDQDPNQALRQAHEAAQQVQHGQVLDACDAGLVLPPDDTETLSELRFLRADSLRHLGRWEDAAEEFSRLIDLSGDGDVQHRVCRAHRLLSELCRRSRAYPDALQHGLRAVELAIELDDPVGIYFSRLPLARVYSDVGRREDAESMVRSVLEDAPRLLAPDDPGLALVTVAAQTVLSLVLFRKHRLAEATSALTSVTALAEGIDHAITQAAYHRQLAILHEVQRNYSTAVRHLKTALALYEQVRYEPGLYDVYWSLSLSYTDLGDLRTARLCLEQCESIAERLNLKLELAKTKSSFGELRIREGDYEGAIELFRQDLLLSRGIGDQQALGHCNRKLAECYHAMGDLKRAETHAKGSIQNFEATSRTSEANLVRVTLGRILVEAARLDEAANCLADAVANTGEGERRSNRSALLRLEALVARARGDLPAAIEAFEESLALQDREHPTRELAGICFEAGQSYREYGDEESAKRHWRDAVEVAGLIGSRDLWERILDELSLIDMNAAQRLRLKPYLPGRAVDELSDGVSEPRLTTATVMFVDMRGATALSGQLSPLELSDVVDAFLGPVTRILLRWQGTVDKFIGDCVVAVFGVQDEGDGADQAVHAGLEIIEYMEATKAVRLRAGASVMEATIGINTGEVATGCFGPLLRRDYTVLGYHVNLAQRLQGVAGSVRADLGTRMVIAGPTRDRLSWAVPVLPIDLTTVTMKGIETEGMEAWLVDGSAALRDAALAGQGAAGAAP